MKNPSLLTLFVNSKFNTFAEFIKEPDKEGGAIEHAIAYAEATAAFVLGAGNAVASNLVLGALGTRGNPSDFGSYAYNAALGQQVGDYISFGIGIIESSAGIIEAAGGVAGAPFSGGLSLTATVQGVGIATHGLAVTQSALTNLTGNNSVVKASDGNDLTRKKAIEQAKNHSQVSRASKGGEKISIDDLNSSSRGKNWNKMKANGSTKLGQKNPNGKNYWMEHPDGHPDAGKPGVPAHHGQGHIHSVNAVGEKKIFPYND